VIAHLTLPDHPGVSWVSIWYRPRPGLYTVKANALDAKDLFKP